MSLKNSGWQPISTAPKDGTEFFVWVPCEHKGYQERACYEDGHLCVITDGTFSATDFYDEPFGDSVKWWTPELPAPEDE